MADVGLHDSGEQMGWFQVATHDLVHAPVRNLEPAGIGRLTGSLWRTQGVSSSTASYSSDTGYARRPSRSVIQCSPGVAGIPVPVTGTQIAVGTTACVQGEVLLS